MKVLDYRQREEMKAYGRGYNILIDYSHWQRFIEPLIHYQIEFPDFTTYRNWLVEFPGWSYELIDKNHPNWEVYSCQSHFPMNEYYDKLNKLKR